jgi:hypothetical protein
MGRALWDTPHHKLPHHDRGIRRRLERVTFRDNWSGEMWVLVVLILLGLGVMFWD